MTIRSVMRATYVCTTHERVILVLVAANGFVNRIVWNGIASWGTNLYVVWTSFIADTLLWLRSHCGKADTEQIRTGSNTFQTLTAARYKSRIDGIPHYHKTKTIFPINSNWFLITFPHECWMVCVFSWSYCRCSILSIRFNLITDSISLRWDWFSDDSLFVDDSHLLINTHHVCFIIWQNERNTWLCMHVKCAVTAAPKLHK